DIAVQLYVLRLTSVLLGVAVIALAYLIAREVFPGNNIVIRTVPSFLLFMPMYSFIANSYTNEVMSDFSAALWLYAMVVILKRGFSVSRGLTLVAALVMAYLSKRSGLFLIPLSAVCVPSLVSRWKGRRHALVVSLAGVGGMVLVVLAIAALPVGGLRYALLDRYFWGSFGGFLSTFSQHDYLSSTYLGLLMLYFQTLFTSFWGVFGWMNVWLDDAWYWAIGALCLAATAGMVLLLLPVSEKQYRLTASQRSALLLSIAAIAFAIAPAIAQYSSEFNPHALPQGRYLFPAAIPVSLLIVVGLYRITPAALTRMLPLLLISLMFLFDSVSLALYIIPFYYT
ncbi:MAG: DUF2142 domain-containing protein, partial [Dehalococcoidia bacterium]|nr:DUF2142 domain-containing protein [Dehalococcoidia bacterium]